MQFAPNVMPGCARRSVSPAAGILMTLEAYFAVAAVIYFGTGFTQAAIPETVIAVVLGAGSAAVLSSRAQAWQVAIGTTCFAIFGTLVGLAAVATGRQDVPDLAHHASILAVPLTSLIIFVRPSGQ
ncbi:MAG TPA: hypothetical protein VLW50_04345 [Streptosporangiaceae bacterium]|nr:hypothetical protein [Streptosporangiaceae bacterium]